MKRFVWAAGCAAVVLIIFYAFNRQDSGVPGIPPPKAAPVVSAPSPSPSVPPSAPANSSATSAASSTAVARKPSIKSQARPAASPAAQTPLSLRACLEKEFETQEEELPVDEATTELALLVAGRCRIRFEVDAGITDKVTMHAGPRLLKDILNDICRQSQSRWEVIGDDVIRISRRQMMF